MLKPREIEYIVNDAESKLFFVEDILVPQMQAAAPNLKSVEKYGVIHINAPETEIPEGCLSLDRLFVETDDVSEPMGETDDDMCSLMYTSGTEFLPKGVMNTHKNFFHTLMSGVIDLNIKRDDVALLSIPLYHVAGKYLLLEFINVGTKPVLEDAPNPVEILELTQKERVTYWVYPPTLYQVLPSIPNFDKYDLSSLKKFISFGAVMPVPLLQQWKKMFPHSEWRNYYGQTESTPWGPPSSRRTSGPRSTPSALPTPGWRSRSSTTRTTRYPWGR